MKKEMKKEKETHNNGSITFQTFNKKVDEQPEKTTSQGALYTDIISAMMNTPDELQNDEKLIEETTSDREDKNKNVQIEDIKPHRDNSLPIIHSHERPEELNAKDEEISDNVISDKQDESPSVQFDDATVRMYDDHSMTTIHENEPEQVTEAGNELEYVIENGSWMDPKESESHLYPQLNLPDTRM